MKLLRPRALVHRGSIEALGLLVDPAYIGMEEARRRVLGAWLRGTRVRRVGEAFLVVWPERRRVRAEEAAGAPVVSCGPALAALPLSAGETSALSPPAETLVVAREGELLAEPLGPEIDISEWISLGEVRHEETAALIQSAKQEIRPAEVASAARVDQALRQQVGDAPQGHAAIVQAIRKAQRGEAGNREGATPGAGIRLVFQLWVLLLRSLLGPGARPAFSPPRETPGARLARALRNLAAQVLLRLRLAAVFGRWQAEYLGKMLDLFEQDDLEDALRYAIPLGGSGADAGPALLPPKPRANLSLTAGASSRSTIAVGQLYAELGRRYRTAFTVLDGKGDIDRAAFVLAELLRVSAEAVAYLETHRRFALAAELAETRHLAPEYAVRLWFRAGEVRRAVLLARREGCFAIALERLERQDLEASRALRLAWADACAETGDYLGAARIARPVPSARHLVTTWIDRAIEIGGASAATASILKLELDPGAFVEVRTRMHAVLDETGPTADAVIQALFTALSGSSAPEAAVLARMAARAALAGAGRTPRALIERLVACAGDGSLRLHALRSPNVERPTLPPAPAETEPILHTRDAHHRNGLIVHDASLVAHDRLLVALGELGVRLLALDGRVLARFDAPATALVVSTQGDRALAVARRDGALEVARIDVVRRRVQRWGLLDARSFASTFDGATWFVIRVAEILALDTTADDFAAVWQTRWADGNPNCFVHQVGDRLVATARYHREDGVVGAASFEVFELPALTLRHRFHMLSGAIGGLGTASLENEEWVYGAVGSNKGFGPILCREPRALEAPHVTLTPDAWCLSGRRPDGTFVVRLGWLEQESAIETSTCIFASPAAARICGRVIVAFDESGRALMVDVRSGELLAELAVSV